MIVLLLAALTITEAQQLQELITRDLQGANNEIDALAACPKHLRDDLYGADVLEGICAVRDDMIDLLADAAFAAHLTSRPKE